VRNSSPPRNTAEWVKEWVKSNKKIFVAPTHDEAVFLTKLFQDSSYRLLIGKRQALQGCPVADPYLVAAAHSRKATIVTQEGWKENSSKLPNVCARVGVGCFSLDGFMEAMRWSF